MTSLTQTDDITDTDWWRHWHRLMTSLVQTAWPKMAASTVMLLWLSNISCKQTRNPVKKVKKMLSHFWFHSYQQGPSLLVCLCMLTSNVRFQIYAKWTGHVRSDLMKQAIMGHTKDRELVWEAVQCEAIHHTKLGKSALHWAHLGHFC